LKKIHIGHHFYGSGNIGDDFMLAGFLGSMSGKDVSYSCCTPYDLTPLKSRFPEVNWLSYDLKHRYEALAQSDVWLGLGGTPFQNSVSNWMTDHLCEEARLCQSANKDMYFLGVGGQDYEAFHSPQTKAIVKQAKYLWMRDRLSFDLLDEVSKGSSKIKSTADLAHLFYAKSRFSAVHQGRLLTCLNFDYKAWPNLNDTLSYIPNKLHLTEQVWLIQEIRPLPGAEIALFDELPLKEQNKWHKYFIDIPSKSLAECILSWPSSEWAITSRFHTALACAWSGSKTVILNTNIKLKSIALECEFTLIDPSADPSEIASGLLNAKSADLNLLKAKALLAEEAVGEFCQAINI
jgi:polysaccharide pyruvyl transferase WcaK-like protein